MQGHQHAEGTGASFIRGNAGRAGTPETGEGQAGVDLTDVYKYPTGGGGEEGAKLFPAVPPDRQRAQTKAQEISPEHRKTLFHCEGGQTLLQVTQRGLSSLSPWRFSKPDRTRL